MLEQTSQQLDVHVLTSEEHRDVLAPHKPFSSSKLSILEWNACLQIFGLKASAQFKGHCVLCHADTYTLPSCSKPSLATSALLQALPAFLAAWALSLALGPPHHTLPQGPWNSAGGQLLLRLCPWGVSSLPGLLAPHLALSPLPGFF